MERHSGAHDSRLDWLADGGSLLVPTRRLAFHLRELYDAEALQAGRSVWPSADVVTWSDLIERLFKQDRHHAPNPARWLSASASRLLWDATIRADERAPAMLSTAGIAASVHRAWHRAHEYEVPLTALDPEAGVEQSAFARWTAAYRDRLERENWVDVSIAPRLVDPAALASLKLALTGFDALTPQQRRFLEVARERGSELPQLEARPIHSQVESRTCTNREAEYDSAARWAARLLEDSPRSRIAIAIDPLDAERDRVRRSLDRVLNPATGQTAGPLPGSAGFAIAAARPVSAWPLIGAALEALATFCEQPAKAAITALLRQPYTTGAQEEAAGRARLDARLRKGSRPDLSLETLRSAAARECPHFAQTLGSAIDVRSAWPARAAPSTWSREFARLLDALGWPGVALDSAEHQARERWLEVLAALGSCDPVAGPVPAAEALRLLRLIADDAQFEPEQAVAPVLVIDPQTCAGMQFDALWCCGLEASRWPSPAVPDPFLPWHWQRAREIPGTTPEACEREAARTFARLSSAAARVVFSRPLTEKDTELLPSPLLERLDSHSTPPEWSQPTLTRALFEARPALEQRIETRFPTLHAGSTLRGGASVLAHQSACPFRAQAEHRLHAVALEPLSAGLDPATRGKLTHEVLERIWGELLGSSQLASLDAAATERLVAGTIADVFAPLARTQDPAFLRVLELEGEWLRRRILELLDIDRRRTPFEVIGCEQAIDFDLEGVRLKLKLDRIDRLESGGLAVIDYKTSGRTELTSWTGERPAWPQLPAYTLAVGAERVAAVVFAALRAGNTGYEGMVRDASLWPGLRLPGSVRGKLAEFETWDIMIALWQRRIGALMRELHDGAAMLARDRSTACIRCHLGTLCRVAEVAGARDDLEVVEDTADAE